MSLHPFIERLRQEELIARTGRIVRVLPTFWEADGPWAPLGSVCRVEVDGAVDGEAASGFAEIVGVDAGRVMLAPLQDGPSPWPGAGLRVETLSSVAPVGDGFLGRAVDGLGRPIDGKGPIAAEVRRPARAGASPLERAPSPGALETGVRAVDALVTLGKGQRIGLFAASGVGKTSLLTQLAQQVEADRCVICLVGERGREVEAFWNRHLDRAARTRTVMVAATSDQPAALRAKAADQALSLAEHWRDEGLHVLVLFDSMTRYAMALREIGLAAGEPPTVRAYTPGVFAAVPKLIERCGAARSGGAITALVTVLTETDEADDPLTELMKSILDGHIVLSRELAELGHFPAIDAPRSISRLADEVADEPERALALKAIELLSAYDASRTMIDAGVYAKGANAVLDEAVERRPALMAFLRQGRDERSAPRQTFQALRRVLGEAGA